jgi:8-oxo-dGTP pyrophosphatase MutT (NUDIX family)
MEPLLKEKRLVAAFIPYRKNHSGEFEFFLQMRDEHAPVHPNIYSLFGGGVDAGESVFDGFLRETAEELDYVPKNPQYFSVFESARGKFHVYIEEVFTDFESLITVNEGKYGSFLTYEAIEKALDTSALARAVTEDMQLYFEKNQ